MKKLVLFFILFPSFLFAQKKPLDHSVYDEWQRVSERTVSNDGKWIAYTVVPQEGDGMLYILSADEAYQQQVPRGYSVKFTNDSKYAIFKIKPFFKDAREAQIKKKKGDKVPKDSLGILQLGKTEIRKIEKVNSYQLPEKGSGWLAFQKQPIPKKPKPKKNKMVDRLKKEIDSLKKVIHGEDVISLEVNQENKQVVDTTQSDSSDIEGSTLVFLNLNNNTEIEIYNTGSYTLDKPGKNAVVFLKDLPKDSVNKNGVLLFSFEKERGDTILTSINDAKQFTFDEKGDQLAFVAESDTNKKALQKYYRLYLHQKGEKSANVIADREQTGIPGDWLISEYGNVRFSKNGQRLFFGTAPTPMPKDTATKDIDRVNVDIWHYNDDYLQPEQLKRKFRDERANYLALYDLKTHKITQIGDEGLPTIITPDEGNAAYFVGTTDTGRRVQTQWSGHSIQDIYRINAQTGEKTLVKKNLSGYRYISPKGKYIFWYDNDEKNYFTYNGNEIINISSKIPTSIVNEENDMPNYPRPYGIMGWLENDKSVFIYDRYDVWKVDPEGKNLPINITQKGRTDKKVYRYNRTDFDEDFLKQGQTVVFNIFNDVDKSSELAQSKLSDKLTFQTISKGDYHFSNPVKAKDADLMIYTKQNFVQSPDLYAYLKKKETKISAINPQQSEYNWGTAELFHWTTFQGSTSTGIVYKPEDFNPNKKYPVLLYFYEKMSDRLNNYMAPSPTPSRLDITFFVSRGYVVFVPDISYTIGHPGESAYDYIVSGAKALAKNNWVDVDNIGIQGQSWGGYQVAYLVTRTNMFKAAWSGAPVANMFSAYGGIRWATGKNRQFQYEHTQSRIGATIWDRPDLYVENSPLFHLKNVSTPMVIMANDNDGAVPWYQGIELFTAMRRLNKKVWLLNYNGEAHNLVERKNRKDISIREQQFFDWLLKGERPAKWITDGVPAVNKGKDMGLEVE